MAAMGQKDKPMSDFADASKNLATSTAQKADATAEPKPLRAGIIGLDTSHVLAFTKTLNAATQKPEVAGCRLVAAYPKGSPDIKASTERVPGYTEEMKKLDVEIVDSIEELLKKVDVVFLESNDGRPHLEQYLPVAKAGKPCFIDKPIAGSLSDAVAIFEVSRKYKAPVFSSSSLRFGKTSLAVRGGSLGKVLTCETTSPASLEVTHPDLFWYGIHGCEIVYTLMGPGCESVTRTDTKDADIVTGRWHDGRTATFHGLRAGKRDYGVTAFAESDIVTATGFQGYEPLVTEIARFFKTGQPPVSAEETIELYAFMEAADESKRQGGKPVLIEDVLKKHGGAQ